MTKEKIIETIAHKLIEAIGRDTVDRFEEDKDGNLKISLVSLECVAEKIADELLALIEQEKQEIVECKDRTMQQLLEVQKREIFRAVHYELLGSGHSYLIKDLAKEYGVEL